MKTRRDRLSGRAKRFLDFLKVFMRNKKGIFGFLIIAFFVLISVGAPLLTPYTPLGTDPETGQPVAYKYCVPSWLRLIPPQLGGRPELSENLAAVSDPAFPKLKDDGGEWEFIVEGDNKVSAFTQPNVSSPFKDVQGYNVKNGSIEIRFERSETGTLYNEVKVYLQKEFYYPFNGPPVDFEGNIALLVDGSTHLIKGAGYLDVPVRVKVFLGAVGGKMWTLWPASGTEKTPYGFPVTSNDNGVTAPTAPPLSDNKPFKGKFFGQGMRGPLPEIGIYAQGTGNITIAYSSFFGRPKIGSVKISVNSTTWDWCWAEVNKFWEHDALFVWIESVEGSVYYGYDSETPVDAISSFNEGVSWRPEYNTRYFIRLSREPLVTQPKSGKLEGWILSKATVSSPELSLGGIGSESTRLAMGMGRQETNPVSSIFAKKPGRYVYGIELTFIDKMHPEKSVSSTVYIDDFYLNLLGSGFGLLGTDHEGKDLYSQLIYGTRISLYLGIAVSVMTVILGLSVGLAAGYLGRWADQLLMRFNDLMLCLPTLPLLIVLAAVLGHSIENLMVLMTLIGWNGFARVVRSMTLSLKERPFVESAKAVGAGTGYIIWRHILPNVMALVYVSLATSVPGAVTAEAALSWLGFYDPARMSWGRMLYNVSYIGGTIQIGHNPFWVLLPGLAISLLAVSFILLGYALDDILNPRLRLRR